MSEASVNARSCSYCRHKKAFPDNTPCSRCHVSSRWQRQTTRQIDRETQYNISEKNKLKKLGQLQEQSSEDIITEKPVEKKSEKKKATHKPKKQD